MTNVLGFVASCITTCILYANYQLMHFYSKHNNKELTLSIDVSGVSSAVTTKSTNVNRTIFITRGHSNTALGYILLP